VIVGIGPALGVALALFDAKSLALADMPTLDVVRGKAKRRDLDGQWPPPTGVPASSEQRDHLVCRGEGLIGVPISEPSNAAACHSSGSAWILGIDAIELTLCPSVLVPAEATAPSVQCLDVLRSVQRPSF
jgi:hypothetical protein